MLTSSSKTARRARQMIELLEDKTPKFIPPDLWPHYSLDLHPDLKISGVM